MTIARVAIAVLMGWLAACGPALAQAPARDATRNAPPNATNDATRAALKALAARLELPLVDEAIATFSAQLRRTVPSSLVASAGRNAGFGPAWKAGEPTFDRATREVDAVLRAEEARGGPLLAIERTDLLDAVQVPWTLDDIAFIDETLPTPLGREAQRAIDAKATEQVIRTLERRVPASGDGLAIRRAFDDLDRRAQMQYGDAMLTILPLRGTDPARARRLQQLVDAVTVAPSDALGQRLVDRLSQRLVDAALRGLPNLIEVVTRRSS